MNWDKIGLGGMYYHNFSKHECKSSLLFIWSKLSISRYTKKKNLESW